ncbi:MAG: DUF4760 domain-containing protein [Proteobacteria bacterium]|nr:DUF4760 domain-containing protein [Pseudomonadota bacterium]
MSTATAILIAAGVAAVGWIYTNRTSQRTDRRRHTYDVFQEYRHSEKFLAALSRARELILSGDIPDPADPTRKDDIAHLDDLLEHYEFIAIAIFNGDVDERFVRECEYSAIVALPERFSDFIIKARNQYQQQTMYKAMEDLSARWAGDPPKRPQRIYEWVRLCPCREPPKWLAWLNSKF